MSPEDIANQLLKCFKRGNKVLICGNGGSAQQANHFAAELIHEMKPAISLTSDMSVVTSVSNDYHYDVVFSQQIWALGKEGDILIGLSTSGKSLNILNAYETAKALRMEVIDFPRKGSTPRCQEYQLRLLHKVWEVIRNS